ncbi:zinc metalloproteinase nas-15-like, partial [Orbicella faveolata]|uniref:zinc metalloproteinase nas-15-like n=1 Tax=Orbicella faveolata TaxID=48498 RepID=UPI0009E595EB
KFTVCEDNPSYADACPEKAAVKDYCQDQENFMRKNCPKSCGFCINEPVKPPAPAVCEDDPNYADACPEKAEIKNYCQDQEKFMRKNCPKSCGFCFNGD